MNTTDEARGRGHSGRHRTAPPSYEEQATRLRWASELESRPVTWLWPRYFPGGKFCLLEGDPALGKSVITLDLAARASTGGPWPDGTRPPTGPTRVMILTAEDDIEDTVKPRLEAAGANLDLILFRPDVLDENRHGRSVELPYDIEILERDIVAGEVGLLIIDPLLAFVGSQYDAHHDQQVRHALHPFRDLGRRTGAVILGQRHLNKRGEGPAMYRGGGSIAFIGLARAAFLVAPHPENAEARVMRPIKTNLGPPPPALGFRLEYDSFRDQPVVSWTGSVELPADDAPRPRGRQPSVMEEATRFLMDLIPPGESMLAVDVRREAERDGHAWRTVQRAASEELDFEITKLLDPETGKIIGSRWYHPG